MIKKSAIFLFLVILMLGLQGCGKSADSKAAKPVKEAQTVTTEAKSQEDHTANWLGGLKPDKALDYMKQHHKDGLVIVEVNTDYWKLKTGFTGALHIPHDQMAKRYNEIPKGKPVILHCGAGVVSKDAYKVLQEKRKDIPQLSYIDGVPPVEAYNNWLKENKG